MNTKELFEELQQLWDTFVVEHAKGNKASQGRARKAIGALKKTANEYRKASVAENKK